MDEFSTEFLRIENFMEKFLPVKIQNQIAEILVYVLTADNKVRLKEIQE